MSSRGGRGRRSTRNENAQIVDVNEAHQTTQGTPGQSYNLRRDHSKPKRYVESQWLQSSPNKLKPDSNSNSNSPVKSPRRQRGGVGDRKKGQQRTTAAGADSSGENMALDNLNTTNNEDDRSNSQDNAAVTAVVLPQTTTSMDTSSSSSSTACIVDDESSTNMDISTNNNNVDNNNHDNNNSNNNDNIINQESIVPPATSTTPPPSAQTVKMEAAPSFTTTPLHTSSSASSSQQFAAEVSSGLEQEEEDQDEEEDEDGDEESPVPSIIHTPPSNPPPSSTTTTNNNSNQISGGDSSSQDNHHQGQTTDVGKVRRSLIGSVGGRGGGGRSRRAIPTPADLSVTLRENLKRLKNLLKLPKARRWVFCEFFYSDIDRELFLGQNEFSVCLRESFPNLKTRSMTRVAWSEIRRLIGKPRRCSQAFFDEERRTLGERRQKVRDIHSGSVLVLEADIVDIPSRIPQPLVVGAKVYARVRNPKDGIYSGIVDAVLPESYRIIFDKELVPPTIIRDFEVMSEAPEDLVSVAYFLEKNKAAAPISVRAQAGPSNQSWLSPTKVLSSDTSPLIKYDPVMSAAMHKTSGESGLGGSPHRQMRLSVGTGIAPTAMAVPGSKGDERVGNFPLRLLVMLVKLAKLIDMKRSLVRQIQEMNSEAERINLLTHSYPRPFQEKYAQVVVDLEDLNKQVGAYLNGVSEYYGTLLPHLSEVTVTSRPETLRKLCHTHGVQIVKHCNVGLCVRNPSIIELITSLTALLLQVRSLGQQSCNAMELNTLSEALGQLRMQIHSSNAAAFQDNVEVHMKQIHNSMLRQSSADPNSTSNNNNPLVPPPNF